ncbi:hypothetical protein EON65_18655 [archaeon]|nr:MAG: hypothetical protein EON65_18655 [archaeon]
MLHTVTELRTDLERTTSKIKSLEAHNEQLSSNYVTAKGELDEVRKKFKETREYYMGAVQDKFEAERQHQSIMERLKSQLQDKTQEFEKIRDELVPQDIDQLRMKVQEELEIRHKQELKALESELELQREKNFATRRELERTRTEYTSLLQNQQTEITNLRVEKEQLVEAARQAALKYRQVDTIDHRDEKIRTQGAKIGELSHMLELVKDEVKAVRQERDDLTATYDQTKAKLDITQASLNAKLAAVETDKHGLEQRVNLLESDVERKESHIRSLKLSSDDAANRLDDSVRELEAGQRSWQHMKNDLLKQLDYQKDSHEREVGELNDQIDALRSTVSDREDMLRKMQRETSDIEQRAENMERDLRRGHLLQLQEARNKMLKSEHDLADAMQQIRAMQDQVQIVQEQASFEKDTLISEVSRLKREKEILYSKLRDMENNNDLQRKKLVGESQEASAKLAVAEKKLRDAITQQTQSEGKVANLNAKIADLENDRQRERNNYDQLEHRYSQLLLQVDAMKTDFHSQLQTVAPSVKEKMDNLQRQMKVALSKERKRAEGYKAKALEAHYKIKALGEL